MNEILNGKPTQWERDVVAIMQKYIASPDAIKAVLMYWRKIHALEQVLKDDMAAAADVLTQNLIDEYLNAPTNPFIQQYGNALYMEFGRCVRDWLRAIGYQNDAPDLKELDPAQAVKLLSNRTSYIMLSDVALRYAGKPGDYFKMSKEMNDELLAIEVK